MVQVQALDFAVVIGQHVDAFTIRVVATAIFVNERENLGADGRSIVAVADRKGISLSFLLQAPLSLAGGTEAGDSEENR